MEFLSLPLGNWVNVGVDWLTVNLAVFFDTISDVIRVILTNLEYFLYWLPWPVVIAIFVLIAWRVTGWRVALFVGAGLYFMGALGLWEASMTTVALIVTAVAISLLIGIPLGIVAARYNTVWAVLRPVLDAMQTIPSFVYLIPAIMFFGIGNVPGVIATVIFAVPPAVRMTNLGIREVPSDVVEAAVAFGSTARQLLMKVQLPLARPTIMAGVNQTIMLALSMVVVAGLVGAGGLGEQIVRALGHVDVGRGAEAGLAILVIAIILDRITTTLGRRKKKRGIAWQGA
jgi:glycine betaine/proline transport system permease protein